MNTAFQQFVDALSIDNLESLCSAIQVRHMNDNREGLPEVIVLEMEMFTGFDLATGEQIQKCSRKKALKLYCKRTKLPLKAAQRAFGRAIAENCTEYGKDVLAKTASYIKKAVKEFEAHG